MGGLEQAADFHQQRGLRQRPGAVGNQSLERDGGTHQCERIMINDDALVQTLTTNHGQHGNVVCVTNLSDSRVKMEMAHGQSSSSCLTPWTLTSACFGGCQGRLNKVHSADAEQPQHLQRGGEGVSGRPPAGPAAESYNNCALEQLRWTWPHEGLWRQAHPFMLVAIDALTKKVAVEPLKDHSRS